MHVSTGRACSQTQTDIVHHRVRFGVVWSKCRSVEVQRSPFMYNSFLFGVMFMKVLHFPICCPFPAKIFPNRCFYVFVTGS